MKNFAEMLVHIPLSSHYKPKNVLVLSSSKEIKLEVEKHNIQSVVYSLPKFSKEEKIKYDVVISDKNIEDMSELDVFLKDDSIVVMPTVGVENSSLKDELRALDKYFMILMPYSFLDKTILFASKKSHPIADHKFQVSDFLEDNEYYHTEMQRATFIYPQNVIKDYLGFFKN